MKKMMTLLGLVLLLTSAAGAELPVYPGAKPFGPPSASVPGGVTVDVKMPQAPGMPGMAGLGRIKSASSSHNYSVPAGASFEEIKKFYAAALGKLGYTEKASLAAGGIAMPTESVSFSSGDGAKSVTITLTANPAISGERLLAVSESETSLQ